jgi:formate hydrogenlyase subunit 4
MKIVRAVATWLILFVILALASSVLGMAGIGEVALMAWLAVLLTALAFHVKGRSQ